MMDFIAKEPLIKAILAGHNHFNYESLYADRIPQIVTGITDGRIVEFV